MPRKSALPTGLAIAHKEPAIAQTVLTISQSRASLTRSQKKNARPRKIALAFNYERPGMKIPLPRPPNFFLKCLIGRVPQKFVEKIYAQGRGLLSLRKTRLGMQKHKVEKPRRWGMPLFITYEQTMFGQLVHRILKANCKSRTAEKIVASDRVETEQNDVSAVQKKIDRPA